MDKTKISRSLKLQVTDIRERSDVRSLDGREGSEIRKNYSGMVVPVVRRVADVRGFEGGPDVRKTSVVRWDGDNARCEYRDAILGGILGFWGQN